MAYKDSYKYSLNRHNLNRLLFINDSHTTDTSSELFLSLPERPIFDVDVTRYDNRYIVTIDLPGMSKNNILILHLLKICIRWTLVHQPQYWRPSKPRIRPSTRQCHDGYNTWRLRRFSWAGGRCCLHIGRTPDGGGGRVNHHHHS